MLKIPSHVKLKINYKASTAAYLEIKNSELKRKRLFERCETKNENLIERQNHSDTCDSGTRLWSAWGRCWREWDTPGSTAACATSWVLDTPRRRARAPRPAQPCTLRTSRHQGACRCSRCCSLYDAEPQPSPFFLNANQEKAVWKVLLLWALALRVKRLKILWLCKVRLGLEWEHLLCLLAKVRAKMLKAIYTARIEPVSFSSLSYRLAKL